MHFRKNVSNKNKVLKHKSEIFYFYYFFSLSKQSSLDSPNWASGFLSLDWLSSNKCFKLFIENDYTIGCTMPLHLANSTTSVSLTESQEVKKKHKKTYSISGSRLPT